MLGVIGLRFIYCPRIDMELNSLWAGTGAKLKVLALVKFVDNLSWALIKNNYCK